MNIVNTDHVEIEIVGSEQRKTKYHSSTCRLSGLLMKLTCKA